MNIVEELQVLEDELSLLQVKIMQGNNLTRAGISNYYKMEVLQSLENKVKKLMEDEEGNFLLIQTINNFIESNL